MKTCAPGLLCFFAAGVFTGPAWSQENKATVTVGGQTKSFSQAVVVMGESYGEKRIMIVATNQPLSADILKKVQKKDAEENADGEIGQNYLKAVFRENGEIRYIWGHTGRSSFGSLIKPEDSTAKIENGRIFGKIKFVKEGDFPLAVDWTFDVPMGTKPTSSTNTPAFDPPVKPNVSGTFTGNGKAAKLAYVSAFYHEPFSDKESVAFLFTEKDHSKDPKAQTRAAFGDYGSALILSVHADGGIFGCEVAHSAHAKAPFSSIGSINMQEFDMSKGNVKGHVTTNGDVDTFDQKWDVDLTFAAPLPAEYRDATKKADPKASSEKDEDDEDDDDEDDKPKAAPTVSVMEIPIPKDATDVEFSKLTGQVKFNSPLSVRAAVKQISDGLAAKDWSNGEGGVIGQKNAILNRVKKDASLKIMLKPIESGSVVVIFTENLNWEGAPKKKKDKRASDDDDDDPETEIRDAVKDALKESDGVPKEATDAIDKALDEIFK